VHGSVLQNKKYIKFAGENTVEVMALGRLGEGIEKKDKRAATYRAKDEDGAEQDFLLEWPNLTVDDISKMRGSKAGTYNNTGKIPYTAIVNPHTLEEMEGFKGGFGGGKLMDAVKLHKKALSKEYGKSTSRKTLKKVRKAEKEIAKLTEAGALSKALAAAAKLEKKCSKESPALIEIGGKARTAVIAKCGEKLDELEAVIGRGELAAAKKELGPLARALKGTPLAERAGELLARTKVEK